MPGKKTKNLRSYTKRLLNRAGWPVANAHKLMAKLKKLKVPRYVDQLHLALITSWARQQLGVDSVSI